MSDDQYFADVKWTIEDVLSLAEELGYKVNEQQAWRWISRNEKHIRDRLIELGWGVMETLMSLDHPDGSDQK